MLLAAPTRAAAPAATPLQVHLPRSVQVESAALSLGAVSVLHAADAALAEKAGGIALGRAPRPGEEIVIDRPTILGRLASSGIDASRVVLSGADRVSVGRKETAVPAEEIVAAAEACLGRERPAADGSRWAVRRMPPALLVPAGDEPRLLARLAPHGVPDEMKVEVVAQIDGRAAASQVVLFQKAYVQREAVAKTDLPTGSVLTAENVEIRPRMADRPPSPDWTPPFGLLAAMPLKAGAVIPPAAARALRPEIAVHRGGGVTMCIQGAGFQIRALGQALEDGRPGEAIRVRNVDSGRILLARVAADGTVEPALSEVNR